MRKLRAWRILFRNETRMNALDSCSNCSLASFYPHIPYRPERICTNRPRDSASSQAGCGMERHHALSLSLWLSCGLTHQKSCPLSACLISQNKVYRSRLRQNRTQSLSKRLLLSSRRKSSRPRPQSLPLWSGQNASHQSKRDWKVLIPSTILSLNPGTCLSKTVQFSDRFQESIRSPNLGNLGISE